MKFTASFTLFLLALPTAVVSSSNDDFSLENYCRTAQKIIAGTELDAELETPPTFKLYEKSKPQPFDTTQEDLVVPQFVGNPPSAPDLQTVLCKMKDAGSIRKYLGIRKAGRTKSCADVNRAVVESVLAQNPSLVPPNIDYDIDWHCITGSQWTHNSPAVTAYKDDAGTLHLVGKSLTGFPWWFPASKIPYIGKFLEPLVGVYYCQVISAESVKSILQGTIVPPTCGPPPTNPYSIFNAWDCPMKSSSTDETL